MDALTAKAYVNQGLGLTPEATRALQEERLHKLVDYARAHSRVYARLYASLKESYTLQDVPVSDKATLMARMDDWFTDPAVTEAVVRQFLNENTLPGTKLLDRYSVLSTSGTTGQPMPMVRDASHDNIHAALMASRLLKEVDAQLLNPIQHRIAAVLYTSGKVSSYSSFKRMVQATGATDKQAIAISILDPLPHIIKQLNDFQPETITGYPSVLADLAYEQQRGSLHIHPKLMVCSAETLTKDHYRVMREVFQCPILNNYCSTEGGEVAMSCPEGNLHLNQDCILVEPIDENGQPVPDGTLSQSILLTDLTNFIQPIIRYRVDDHVRISHTPCPCGNPLPTIEIIGRKGGNITLCGKSLNTLPLAALMEEEERGTINYQFVQTDSNTLEFRATLVNPSETYILDRVCHRIQAYLVQSGFDNAQVVPSKKPLLASAKGGKCQHYVGL